MKSNTSMRFVRRACARGAVVALVLGTAVLAAVGCDSDGGEGSSSGGSSSGDGGGTASTKPAWMGLTGARQADLPHETPGVTTSFVTGEQCRQCHQANEANKNAVRDAKGRDVSPGTTWRKSMMGLAARDPFYLAAWAEERVTMPGIKGAIDGVCSRCHATAGNVETGGKLSFEDLVSGTSNEARVARDGVTCTVCHQIQAAGLGTPASFTGGFTIGASRELYGPHLGPATGPMTLIVNYTPVYSNHVVKSSFCATCHTVITPARDDAGALVGAQFPEQTPYLEWQNSAFQDEVPPTGPRAMSCVGCHAPAYDDDNQGIKTALSVNPTGLAARDPFGRHHFAGGSSSMLRLMAKNAAWVGTDVAPSELEDQAKRSDAHLSKAAELAVVEQKREGGTLIVRVKVTNSTGHKLPTGYPSRRMWLHLAVKDGATTTWESGAWDAYGRIVDGAKLVDVPGTFQPHRDVVSAPGEVQIWEGVAGKQDGSMAGRLLEAAKYVKDDRLLPEGYKADHKVAIYMRPQGVAGDPDFGSSDTVTYKITPAPPPGAAIAVELVYQSIKPSDLDALAKKPTPIALKFFDLVESSPIVPVVMVRAEARAP